MSVQVQLIKAFTKNPEMGNPAGVLLDSQGLSDEQMQAIATDLGFSESVFITPSDKADYKTRFFAPKVEVDYCGHATVDGISVETRLANHFFLWEVAKIVQNACIDVPAIRRSHN
jgi:PhzF family phenazine biosynthesis protein